jgi:hypothetical protein
MLLAITSVQAQCPQGSVLTLSQWSSTGGYTSGLPADDEGLTNPPIALTAIASFPMPGAIGTLDQLWVNSNGELYLTDSTLGLAQPVDGALYGADSFLDLQGDAPGASARIVVMGDDTEASVTAAANWSVSVDQSVPGQVRVSWIDMARYANTTDRFSFACTLYASGLMQFDYSATVPADVRFVGVSVGNTEPSTSGSQDLTSLPSSSATDGLIYEQFTAATWDLSDMSILIAPDFTPGVENYTVVAVTPLNVPCAGHQNYGTGCYSIPSTGGTSVYELFPGSVAAKAALDGNAILFVRAGNSYSVNWLPAVAGSLYVAPTGAATVLGLTDDSTATITPSVPVPTPSGSVPVWTVSSNGVLTAAATGNNGTSYTASGAALTGTAAPNLGWYMWRDYNPTTGGQVKHEEVGGVLYVTYDGVNIYGQTSPATFQWQITLATGDVMMVFVSCDASTNTTPVLVGCTLAGVGPDPGSINLATALPVVLAGDIPPMSLSASPRPIINPSTLVTYTLDNIVEFVPGSGVYLSTMFLSASQVPGGVDLGIIGAPGCNAYIGGLEYNLGTAVTTSPLSTVSITFGNVLLAPGDIIYAQAVALFDPAYPLPNGQNTFGLVVSNGVKSTANLF